MFTIEEINDSGFLPGVRLGYVAYDVCADATKALLSVEHLLSINGSLPVLHDYSEFRPHVKAIIGEYYSLVTVPIAKLLSVYLFPQISAASSAAVLSDRLWYPSFFRVIPSDVHQTEAMAQLMLHFGWNWVGLVSMDDDYGRGAHQSFLKDAAADGVCIAYEEVIPHYLGHENSQQRIMEVARQIQQSDAKVVMVILRDELVKMLFEEMIRLKTSRVWIASNIWSSAPLVMDMQDIDKVGDIYGLRFITGNIAGFHDFFNNLTVNLGVKNELIEEYKRITYCSPSSSKDCSKTRAHSLGPTVAYGERVAVWAIAHALRDLLRCNETSCPGETIFPPYQLVEKLRKVKFSLDGEMKFFNVDGDFEDGYEVVMWVPGDRPIKTIGRYNVRRGQMNIDNSDVIWTMTPNNTKPSSQCSESCKSGHFKKMTNISCCYTCLPCGEGTFSSILMNATNVQMELGLWKDGLNVKHAQKTAQLYILIRVPEMKHQPLPLTLTQRPILGSRAHCPQVGASSKNIQVPPREECLKVCARHYDQPPSVSDRV
ncbi:G-protein coupled receptor family C group 6 member A-like [Engraulis encrasicolus]|uniref:G-protein coupled receptor family C group 6 member A-like n=1 Tax=Engraulis encrasicolus TaxID=184585 RepID=UPI002FD52913